MKKVVTIKEIEKVAEVVKSNSKLIFVPTKEQPNYIRNERKYKPSDKSISGKSFRRFRIKMERERRSKGDFKKVMTGN